MKKMRLHLRYIYQRVKNYLLKILCPQFLFIIIIVNTSNAQTLKSYNQRIAKTNIIKFAPVLSGTNLRGGLIAYETGAGLQQVTFQISIKQYFGSLKDSIITKQNNYTRFEIQPRIYGIKYIDGVYGGPLFSIYNNGASSIGFVAGVQWTIKRFVVIDVNTRLLQSNEIENSKNHTPFFIRPSLKLGFLFEPTVK